MVLRPVPARSEKYEASRTSLFASLKSCILQSNSLASLSRFYARLLEMDIVPLQAFHLTHAQLAFFLMLIPVEIPSFIRLSLSGWFAMTVIQCRKSGLK